VLVRTSTNIEWLPHPIVRIAAGDTVHLSGFLTSYSYQNPIQSLTIEGFVSIYETYISDQGTALQFERIADANFTVGTLDCAGRSVSASIQQIATQAANPLPLWLSALTGPDSGSDVWTERYTFSVNHSWRNGIGQTWGGYVRMRFKRSGDNILNVTMGFQVPGELVINAMTGRGFSFAPHPVFAPYIQVYVPTVYWVRNVYVAKQLGSSPNGPFIDANDLHAVIREAAIQKAYDYLYAFSDLQAIYEVTAVETHALYFLNPIQFNTGGYSGVCPASLAPDTPASGLTFLC
jgi:hypothetical protein